MTLSGSRNKKIIILGSTGSIGRQTLQVVEDYPDRFTVIGLAANDEIDDLLVQAQRFQCARVVIADESKYALLKEKAGSAIACGAGMAAICELAALAEADLVLSAISGAAGIKPTIAALENGNPVALANKETLVAAGELVMSLAKSRELPIFPVDSEHSAVFQCLKGEPNQQIRKIWLTASGGPFFGYTREQLAQVTPEMALKHPSWQMGPKITIDSATLINKGLEIIEAHHLFDLGYDYIDTVVSPGSLVHALVEMADGAYLAHIGRPDMRIPIQFAMSYPERWPCAVSPLDLAKAGPISFKVPDRDAFPGLPLAIKAGRQGGSMPAVMNAANEIAVASFLQGQIKFLAIPELIAEVMARHQLIPQPNLEEILQADEWARITIRSLIEGMKS